MTSAVRRRRLAIIGCGAAARICYLPALASDGPFELVALIDKVAEHAQAAAGLYRDLRAEQGGGPGAEPAIHEDLMGALPDIDAAIVATSHATHAEVATAALRAGRHLLIEKPLALTVAQAEQIRAAAIEGNAAAMPAHVRRLFPSAQWLRAVLDSGRLGPLRSVRWSEGRLYSWPLVSLFMFSPSRDGGGVLADSGPHVLDMLRFWLGGPAEVTSFSSNDQGGTDSEVGIGLSFGSTKVVLELSRLRELSNTCVIEAEGGTISVGNGFPATYTERNAAGQMVSSGPVPVIPPAQETWVGLFRAQLADFDRVIDGETSRLADLDDGVAVVRLIEACHRLAPAPMPRPWTGLHRPDRHVGVRVAVTGATGFIGGHVVERLVEGGGRAVALGRDLAKFARLSHLDRARVSYARADIRDVRALTDTFRGTDVVVHTVYGNCGSTQEQWAVTVDGTAAVLQAAIEVGVHRIVYLSTVAVYDTAGLNHLDEDSPLIAPTADDLSYSAQKLAAEDRILSAAAGRIEVVCLQPTVVYGPAAPSWTIQPLRRLPTDSGNLPTGSDTGVCNAVHVQDVADAAIFATTASGVDGARLLVSGPQAVTWGEFYDTYRSLLGLERPHHADLSALDDWESTLYASGATVDTGRLRAIGFTPRVEFADGLAQTAVWAEWAGLL